MKKVKCISVCKEDLGALTINEEYEVLEEYKNYYLILNDKDSNNTFYSKKLFEIVKEEQPKELKSMYCINKKCNHYESRLCPIKCNDKMTPTSAEKTPGEKIHTLRKNNKTWFQEAISKSAEGQQELTQDKENICYNEKCTENEELKNRNARLIQDNHHFKTLAENRGEYNKKSEEEINNLNDIIERKDKELDDKNKKIEDLEKVNKDINNTRELIHEEMIKLANENTEFKRLHENQRLNIRSEMSENRELKAKVVQLQDQLENELGRNRILNEKLGGRPTTINNYEAEINSLRCQYEEAKHYIEVKENEIKILNKKLEESELLGKMIKRLVEGL